MAAFVLWGHIIGNPHAADKGCSISTFRSHAQADQNECQTWFREGGCVVAINVKFHTMVYIGKLAPAVLDLVHMILVLVSYIGVFVYWFRSHLACLGSL